MLGITDIKIPCCEPKSIMFFLHTFFCKERCRRHYKWCFSLWLKFVKKGQIYPNFFRNKKRWERDCNIASWEQRCFKKSFLALKNRTIQFKSKTTKIFNKTGHYNFLLFLLLHFKTQWRRVKKTAINQLDVVFKISQREVDYHTFKCWCNLQCRLFSL